MKTLNEEYYEDRNPFCPECTWGVKDLIKALVIYFILVFIVTPLLFKLTNTVSGKDIVTILGENSIIILFSLFSNIAIAAYIIYLVCFEHKLPLSTLGITLDNWGQNVIEGLKRYCIVLPVLIMSGFVTDYVCRLINITPQQQEIAKKVLGEDSSNVLVLMIIFGAIIAPFVEELMFRGFLQTTLYRYMGRWRAILVSSFFFSLVHLNIYVFLQIFILGIMLAYVFDKTKSIVATITIHVIHNSATFVILLYFRKVF